MQAQLLSVGTENTSKQLAMLRKVIRSLEVYIYCVSLDSRKLGILINSTLIYL